MIDPVSGCHYGVVWIDHFGGSQIKTIVMECTTLTEARRIALKRLRARGFPVEPDH